MLVTISRSLAFQLHCMPERVEAQIRAQWHERAGVWEMLQHIAPAENESLARGAEG